jgi:hypothetical protein
MSLPTSQMFVISIYIHNLKNWINCLGRSRQMQLEVYSFKLSRTYQRIRFKCFPNIRKKNKVWNTVKPELTATFEQRPPVNNGRYNLVTASINLTFIRAPLSNGHFFRVPRVAVVHRFDCIQFKTILSFTEYFFLKYIRKNITWRSKLFQKPSAIE